MASGLNVVEDIVDVKNRAEKPGANVVQVVDTVEDVGAASG